MSLNMPINMKWENYRSLIDQNGVDFVLYTILQMKRSNIIVNE